MGRPFRAVFGMLSILREGIEACLDAMCCELVGVLLLPGVADKEDGVLGVVTCCWVACMDLILGGPCWNRETFPGEELAVEVPDDALVPADIDPSDEKRKTVAVWPDLLVDGICISCLVLRGMAPGGKDLPTFTTSEPPEPASREEEVEQTEPRAGAIDSLGISSQGF